MKPQRPFRSIPPDREDLRTRKTSTETTTAQSELTEWSQFWDALEEIDSLEGERLP